MDWHGAHSLCDPILRSVLADLRVGLYQAQSGSDACVRPQVIEQPDELQLRLRFRIGPKFDCVKAFTEFCQTKTLHLCVGHRPSGQTLGPMFENALFGSLRQQSLEPLARLQPAPGEVTP